MKRSQFVQWYDHNTVSFIHRILPEQAKAHKNDLDRIRVDRCRKKQKNQLSCVIVNQDARRALTVPESIQLDDYEIDGGVGDLEEEDEEEFVHSATCCL